MHLMRAALARERQAHGSQAGLCRWPVLGSEAHDLLGWEGAICWSLAFLGSFPPRQSRSARRSLPPGVARVL